MSSSESRQEADEPVYNAAEPVASRRARIRQRSRNAKVLHRDGNNFQESRTALDSAIERELAEITRVQDDEEYWVKYRKIWPDHVVANLRRTVWSPPGYPEHLTLDILESECNYRQAWDLGKLGCASIMNNLNLLKPGKKGFTPLNQSVKVYMEGTDAKRFLRIYPLNNYRVRPLTVSVSQLWPAQFDVIRGEVVIPRQSPGEKNWYLSLVPNSFMDLMVICLWEARVQLSLIESHV